MYDSKLNDLILIDPETSRGNHRCFCIALLQFGYSITLRKSIRSDFRMYLKNLNKNTKKPNELTLSTFPSRKKSKLNSFNFNRMLSTAECV